MFGLMHGTCPETSGMGVWGPSLRECQWGHGKFQEKDTAGCVDMSLLCMRLLQVALPPATSISCVLGAGFCVECYVLLFDVGIWWHCGMGTVGLREVMTQFSLETLK
jgi:hypothetical protein